MSRTLGSRRGSIRPSGGASRRAGARAVGRRVSVRAIRAFRLRNPCATQPSKIDTGVWWSSARASGSLLSERQPKPVANAKQTSVPAPAAIATDMRVAPVTAPPEKSAAKRNIQSPITPPSPTGSGHAALRGKAAAQPALNSTPKIQNSRRMRSRFKGR